MATKSKQQSTPATMSKQQRCLYKQHCWVFFRASIHKILRSVLLPTDTRHVLKFCKDLFRNVDGVNSNKGNICKTDAIAI